MKVLRVAAIVVGAVALIATGVGAAIGAGIIGTAGAAGGAATFAGVTAATFTAVGAVAGVAASILSYAAAKAASDLGASQSGDQSSFTANKDQGIPYAMGRTSVSGWIVHQQTWDWAGSTDNTFRTFFGIWSGGGPIQQVEAFQLDGTTVRVETDGAGNPTDVVAGAYDTWMWLRTQLGACPEPAALIATGFYNYPAGWTAQSKLSGYAAFAWTLKFDTKGKVYPGAVVPTPTGVLKGVKVYDPRQDSTFPGGSGPCRALDESTYVWEGIDPNFPAGENPFLNGLTWALGRWQNAKQILGIGMAIASIDVPSFAHAANIADANAWKVGGVVYSTDGKWDVMKKILAAGSGEPLQLGGMLSCSVDTPRVSLATITTGDIIGDATITSTAATTDRINGVIPTYRDETQKWTLVPGAKVQVDQYITEDRRPRTKAITWELVQDVNQVSELAVYQICNAREFGPIVMPLKLRWIGYKPGDALTIASSEAGMDSQLVVIQKRHLDPSTGAVTMTMRSETTAKHDYALGKTGTPPPTPSLQTVDPANLLQPGISASWSAIADDDGNKPDDGATKGAPTGTIVSDRNAEQLVADLDINTSGILSQALRLDQAQQILGEVGYVNGQPTATIVENFTNAQTAINLALNSTIALIGAKTPDGTAFQFNLASVQVGAGVTLAQSLNQLGISNSTLTATVSELSSALLSADGSLKIRYALSLNANGVITGFEDVITGSTSSFGVVANHFSIVDPTDGTTAYTVFDITNGLVKMHNVEVDTLKINTAMVPKVVSSSTVRGGTGGATVTLLQTSVSLPVAGLVVVTGAAFQGFPTGSSQWTFGLSINGVSQPAPQGTVPGDAVVIPGAMFCAAGEIPVTLTWSSTGVNLNYAQLLIQAFPAVA